MQLGLLVLACFLTCGICSKMYIATGKDKKYLLKMGKDTGKKKHHGGHNTAGERKGHHKSRKSSKRTTVAQTTIMEVGALEAGTDYSDSSEQESASYKTYSLMLLNPGDGSNRSINQTYQSVKQKQWQ